MSTKKIEKRVSTRKKSVLPLKVKIEMLDRLRLGESFASISRSFNVNESTVRSIKKSEDKIRSSVASTSLSAKIVRDPAIEKMEIESSDIQELLESQDEDLTETDLEEMLNSQPIEEEASTSTENVTFTLKNLSEGEEMRDSEIWRFLLKCPTRNLDLIHEIEPFLPSQRSGISITSVKSHKQHRTTIYAI
ncbi:hypothetical protein ACJJTC_004781 [Scirpophaga incertulas]